MPLVRFRAFLLGCLACGVAGESSAWAASWAKDKLWKDGRAEVAVYDSERFIDGKAWTFREELITAPGELSKDTFVKADKGKTLRVFRLAIAQEIQTKNVPHRYLTDVFVLAKNPFRAVKISAGAQEWGGNAFKILKWEPKSKEASFSFFSHLKGETDGSQALEMKKGDLFEDQLPLSLRSLPFVEGYEKKARVWSSLTTNRGEAPRPVDAKITVKREEVVRGYAGSIPSWKVVVSSEEGDDTYWLAKDSPHIMTKMITKDGRKRFLHGRARWTYWDKRIPMPKVLK